MINEFSRLNDQETELVLKAPILVCILVAGADGTIDKKEIREAINFTTDMRNAKPVLAEFFSVMSEDFEDKIKILIQNYPFEVGKRNTMITKELSTLGLVWRKLDFNFAEAFYEMLLQVAEKIASSSGGYWGMNKIGTEEAKLLGLPMITRPQKK